MNPDAYRIKTAGYTLIRRGLDADRVANLREAMNRLADRDDAAWGRAELERIGQRGALRNLCDEDPAFAALLCDSPIYGLIDYLVAGPYILHSYDGLILHPGEGRFPWDFHSDLMPLVGLGFPPDTIPAINALYYVDDVTSENGATWLVPGSQRSVLRDPPEEVLSATSVQAIGSAGDILLFDARIWHCAGTNRSTESRRVIKLLVCQPWFRPQMDYVRSTRANVREQLSPLGRRLIGCEHMLPTSTREFRSRTAKKAGG